MSRDTPFTKLVHRKNLVKRLVSSVRLVRTSVTNELRDHQLKIRRQVALPLNRGPGFAPLETLDQ